MQSGHVVQSPQPRACPSPPSVRIDLRDGGGVGWRASSRRLREWGAGLQQELSVRPSAEVDADVPGDRGVVLGAQCLGQRRP